MTYEMRKETQIQFSDSKFYVLKPTNLKIMLCFLLHHSQKQR